MDLARYVVEAVIPEDRSYREVTRAHGVSKSWVGKMVARFREGGYEAMVTHLDVRILTEEGEMLRHLTFFRPRSIRLSGDQKCPPCPDTSVHHVLRHHMVGLSRRVCNRGAGIPSRRQSRRPRAPTVLF